jgi:hypothetical protein
MERHFACRPRPPDAFDIRKRRHKHWRATATPRSATAALLNTRSSGVRMGLVYYGNSQPWDSRRIFSLCTSGWRQAPAGGCLTHRRPGIGTCGGYPRSARHRIRRTPAVENSSDEGAFGRDHNHCSIAARRRH